MHYLEENLEMCRNKFHSLLFPFLFLTVVGLSQQPQLVVPVGHTSTVTDACFSLNGKYLATSSYDNTVKIWDIATGRLLQTLSDNKTRITKMSFSAGSNLLLTSSYTDTILKVWDIHSGLVNLKFKGDYHFNDEAIISADEKYLISVYKNGIGIWNIATAKNTDSFSIKIKGNVNKRPSKLVISKDGTMLAGFCNDGVFVLDFIKGKLKKKVYFNDAYYGDEIRFSTDKKFLYCFATYSFVVVDILTGKEKYRAHDDFSSKMKPKITNDERNFLFIQKSYKHYKHIGKDSFPDYSSDYNHRLCMVDLKTKKTIFIKGDTLPGDLSYAEIDDWGKNFVAVNDNGFFVFNITGDRLVLKKVMKDKPFQDYDGCFEFDNNGSHFIKSFNNGTELYDMNGKLFRTFDGSMAFDPKQYFSAEGKYICTSSGNKNNLSWNISDGKFNVTYDSMANVTVSNPNADMNPWDVFKGATGFWKILTTSSYFTLLPVFDSLIGFWKLVNDSGYIVLKDKINRYPYVKLSNTGKYIATYYTGDSLLRLFDPLSGNLVNKFFCKYGSPYQIIFNKQDSLLVWASKYGNDYLLTSEELDKMFDDLQKELDAFSSVDADSLKKAGDTTKKNIPVEPNLTGVISLPEGKTILESRYDAAHYAYSQEISLSFSESEKYLVVITDSFSVWNTITWKQFLLLKHNCLNGKPGWAISPDETKVLIYCNNTSTLYEAYTNKILFTIPGGVSNARFSNDQKYILTESEDKQLRIWDTNTGKLLYNYYALENGSYLVTDEYGRYDGTEDARKKLYYVCGGEIIDLDQFKDKLWVPNLAERIMKGDTINAAKLSELNICGLTPLVETKENSKEQYRFQITPRNGGLGETILYINNIEVKRFLKKELLLKNNSYELVINKKELAGYFIPGHQNPVAVKALTVTNDISSRSTIVEEEVNQSINKSLPNLYAVVVGVSDYKGNELDLRYAAKDANDMADVIENSAKKLLNTDTVNHVFVYRLHTAEGHYKFPEKKSIKETIQQIGIKANANDILLIFFAGHGKWDKDKNQFFFLTADASKESAVSGISDVGISMQELTDWIQPLKLKAQKRILVFDACNSGQAIKDLVKIGNDDQKYLAARDDEKAEQIKAVEKLNNKSGLFILSASASNQYAYEMGRYSQGLLTYSLLKAIKEQPEILDDRKYLNISRWFDAAEKTVSSIASQNGNNQQPQLVSTTNFNIGVVDDDVRSKIIMPGEKPVFASSNFQNSDEDIAADNLGLNKAVDNMLSDISTRSLESKISYIPFLSADAFVLSGRYTVSGTIISVKINIRKNNETKFKFEINSSTDKLAEVSKNISEKAIELITAKK